MDTHLNGITTLGSLLVDHECPKAYTDLLVHGICQDSRQVEPGDLFVALAGSQNNGLDFIDEAVRRGAAAIAVDSDVFDTIPYPPIPLVAVKNLSTSVTRLAATFYENPSEKLRVVSVTGTNGKTSCCWLLSDLLSRLGQRTGFIGTLGYGLGEADCISRENMHKTTLTTPDSITLHKILAKLESAGAKGVALEASSHALKQARLEGIDVNTAVFTNLSRDHLDYHQDMESYGDAKSRLFTMPSIEYAIVNLDDAYSHQLIKKIDSRVKIITYSIDDTSADVYCHNINLSVNGISAELISPWGQGKLRSPLIGQFNLANLLAVAAVCASQYPLSEVLAALPALKPPSGRMELINGSVKPGVVVDFAHTPDALEKVLITLRSQTIGKLWVVFGCGGERDIGKRAKMGSIADRYADYVVLTNDNPRSESETAIISHIKRGIIGKAFIEPDRRSAIRYAIARASPEDLVLIAGKGHEQYQQLGGYELVFSDQEQARLALSELAGGRP